MTIQELDRNNPIFFQAADYILGNSNKDIDIIFLTGKAGTGKTTFLKHIIDNYKGKAVVLAPTGVAAINAGGQTIHSFFCLKPPFFYLPDCPELSKLHIYEHLAMKKEKRTLIEKLDLLIIDEVSMVRCELLDAVDRILRIYRKIQLPFGGVKILLVGDVYQLPPVVKPDEWIQLKDYYTSFHFFNSYAYRNAKVVFFELNKVYRQDEKEKQFMETLDHIREGNVSESDIHLLNTRVGNPEDNESCIRLMTMNTPAAAYNQSKYDGINAPEVTFRGIKTGVFDIENMSNVDEFISLKVGTQVMTMMNCYDIGGNFIYYNGSIATVTALASNAGWVEIRLQDSGRKVIVTPYKWENVVREYDEEKDAMVERTIGSFTQIPMRQAWAITIHKSQGLTFDRCAVNLSRTFAAGQAYVALSRCRRLSGLYLRHEFDRGVAITDPIVTDFYKRIKSEFQKAWQEAERAEGLYNRAWAFFIRGDAVSAIDNFHQARLISNYLTNRIHSRYSRLANIVAGKHWIYREGIKIVPGLKDRNRQLQMEYEEANQVICRLDNENTQLFSRCENMQMHINQLESDNNSLKQDLNKKEVVINQQKEELQRIKQLFIDKTIELDTIKKASLLKRMFKIGW